MVWGITKVILAGTLISLTSWLAAKRPNLAGFLLALPISSLLALLLSYAEFRDTEKATAFARSILVAVPLSLTFFVPFLFADFLKWSFPTLFISGIILLATSYLVHRALLGA